MNMNDPTYVFRIGATLTDMDQYPNRQEYNTQNYDKLKKSGDLESKFWICPNQSYIRLHKKNHSRQLM